MKNKRMITISISVLTAFIVSSGFTNCDAKNNKIENQIPIDKSHIMNMFVTHGHCNTPFSGQVINLDLVLSPRTDLGNPLENMKLSFEIDPSTFNICNLEHDILNQKIKSPGLFYAKKGEMITFKTTNTYTVGIDWYQIDGILTLNGIEKEVKFFATGIREHDNTWPTYLALDGQINLFDWHIDYDKIVNGKSDNAQSKLMYFNMKIPVHK